MNSLPSLRENPVFYLSLLVTIEHAIAAGTIHLTNVIPESWIPVATAWAAMLGFIGSTIITTISAPGIYARIAKPASVAMIVLALLFLTLHQASAVPLPRPKPVQLAALQLPKLPSAAKVGQSALGQNSAPVSPLQKLMNDIANLKSTIIQGAIADLQAADTLAQSIDPNTNQPIDPIAHACYPAMAKFLQTLPTASPPTGEFVAVQLHERLRIFALQVKAGLPTYLKLGCAPLIGDDLQIIIKGLGLVGVAVAPSVLSGGLIPPLPALP